LFDEYSFLGRLGYAQLEKQPRKAVEEAQAKIEQLKELGK